MTYKMPHGADVVSHAFNSVGTGVNTVYVGGFYFFASAADDFNPLITFGTVDAAYAAHLGLVCDVSPGGNTSITVSGTSINDDGVRNAGDSEVVTFLDADAQGFYRETAKKWIGQVSIEKTAGNDRLCNYMFAKYWDADNHLFYLSGFECTWFGNGNDPDANIVIYHHKATGWTYNLAADPTPPTPLYDMQAIYVTEFAVRNNEPGAFKRSAINDRVEGDASEGLIGAVSQSTGRPFDAGTMKWSVKPDHEADVD